MGSSRIAPAVAALLLFLAIAVVLLGPCLAGGQVLSAAQSWAEVGPFPEELRARSPLEGRLQSDEALTVAPWLRYAATAWSIDGRLPLWKSTANCGAPLLGNGQSALLFPPNLLAILLGVPDWSHAALALVKLAGGMFGAWLLARHLGSSWLGSTLCGIAFGLGGFQAVWVLHPLSNVSWLFPLLLLLADRVALGAGTRAVAGLALVAGLQHLGGHPETAFHCQVAALCCGAVRAWSLRGSLPGAAAWRRLGTVAAALTLGAVLGAIQILPVAEYILNSDALAQRLADPGLRGFDEPLWTAVFVAALATGLLAFRRLARSPRPLWAALLVCVAVAGGLLAHLRTRWDDAQVLLLASDWFGDAARYLGPPNYIERNGAYLGAALALAVVGLLYGRPRGVARLCAVGAGLGLLAGCRAPLVDDLLRLLPGFHVAANLRLQLWALLAGAVLAGLGLDALGRAARAAPDRRRVLLALGAPALGVWLSLVAGLQLNWIGPPNDPPVPGSGVPVHAVLGPASEAASLPPPLAASLHAVGIEFTEEWAHVVVGRAWLPADAPYARLDFASSGSSSVMLVPLQEEQPPAGESALESAAPTWCFAFAATVPRIALSTGHIRTRLVVQFTDGRQGVSRVLKPSNDPPERWLTHPLRPVEGDGGRQLLLLAAAGGLAAAGLHVGGRGRTALRCALCALVLATLMPFAAHMLPTLPPELYYPDSPALDPLRELAPDGRLFSLSPWGFPREIPTWYGIRDASGYDAVAPANVATLLRAAADLPGGKACVEELPTRSDPSRPLLGLMAVSLFVASPGGEPPLGLSSNPAFLPRARLATGAIVEPDDERALALLASPGFPRDTTVVLASGEPREPGLQPPSGQPPRIVVDRPDRVVVDVDLSAPALLLLADTFFPGWVARVDGQPRAIRRANVAFRAVELQPGERRIEFSYEPSAFRVGAGLSGLGLLICLGLLLYRPRPNFCRR